MGNALEREMRRLLLGYGSGTSRSSRRLEKGMVMMSSKVTDDLK